MGGDDFKTEDKDENSYKLRRCPECGSKEVFTDNHEVICNACKLVLQGMFPIYSNGIKINYPWGVRFK